MKYSFFTTIAISIATTTPTVAFSPIHSTNSIQRSTNPLSSSLLFSSATDEASIKISFIDTELRGAAMKLHTRSQSPKEGEAEEKPKPAGEPYVPTQMDYLKFLVDSQFVYKTFEDILQRAELHPELEPFVNTGLERNDRLEEDIVFMTKEFDLERPEIGEKGKMYGEMMENIAQKGKEHLPEFMCHYYNYYFAHTAGGRMIGKQMAALLLDRKTLEFYKWDGDLNEMKAKVKSSIEDMAASWTREQKDQCIGATAAAFMGGGGINAYLSGGRGGHH